MTVTEEEYRLLQAWSDVRLYLPRVEDLKEESGSQVFDAAIRQAEEALDLTSVSELAMALPAAYEALKAAMETYTEDLCAGWTPRRESRPYLAFSQSRFFGRRQGMGRHVFYGGFFRCG